MAGIDQRRLRAWRRRNNFRSLAVLAGIGAWMAVIGWLVAGGEGVIWAVAGTVMLLWFEPFNALPLLRRLFGAVRLGPAQAPGLFEIAYDLTQRAGLPRMPMLFYIPDRRLTAWSTGWGRDGAIALSDGLLRLLTARELAAVIAHEISHIRHGDLRLMRLGEAAGRLTRLLSLTGLLLATFFALPDSQPAPWAPLLLLVAAPIVSDLLLMTLSRLREFTADAGAVELTGDPEALASALRRLEDYQQDGWERLPRSPLMRWLRLVRTHPPSSERIRRLAELSPPPAPRMTPPPAMILPLSDLIRHSPRARF